MYHISFASNTWVLRLLSKNSHSNLVLTTQNVVIHFIQGIQHISQVSRVIQVIHSQQRHYYPLDSYKSHMNICLSPNLWFIPLSFIKIVVKIVFTLLNQTCKHSNDLVSLIDYRWCSGLLRKIIFRYFSHQIHSSSLSPNYHPPNTLERVCFPLYSLCIVHKTLIKLLYPS